jgi:hypothetical protein
MIRPRVLAILLSASLGKNEITTAGGSRDGSPKLLRPHGNVRLVLETVHLLDVIPSIEDETQAIDSFH